MMLTQMPGITPALTATPARTRRGVAGTFVATGSFCALAHAVR